MDHIIIRVESTMRSTSHSPIVSLPLQFHPRGPGLGILSPRFLLRVKIVRPSALMGVWMDQPLSHLVTWALDLLSPVKTIPMKTTGRQPKLEFVSGMLPCVTMSWWLTFTSESVTMAERVKSFHLTNTFLLSEAQFSLQCSMGVWQRLQRKSWFQMSSPKLFSKC